MLEIYRSGGLYDPPVDPSKCRALVAHKEPDGGYWQCINSPKHDGLCGVHHRSRAKYESRFGPLTTEETEQNG